jgi:hypothetical protein
MCKCWLPFRGYGPLDLHVARSLSSASRISCGLCCRLNQPPRSPVWPSQVWRIVNFSLMCTGSAFRRLEVADVLISDPFTGSRRKTVLACHRAGPHWSSARACRLNRMTRAAGIRAAAIRVRGRRSVDRRGSRLDQWHLPDRHKVTHRRPFHSASSSAKP